MTSLAATSVLLILSTGCGAVLGTMHRTSGKDRATSRLAEADAQMTCGGQHCDAVPLERSYWDRYSKPWFFGGAAADLALSGRCAYPVFQGPKRRPLPAPALSSPLLAPPALIPCIGA